jgi:outer membrane protein OmpA-like peptidoglycan-associated protein
VQSLSPQFRLFAGLVYYWKPDGSSSPDEVIEPTPQPADLREEGGDDGRGFMAEESDDEPKGGADLLNINPDRSEVFEGTVVPLKATGGIAPYKFDIVDGPGRVDQKGIVRTGREGKIVVRVTDQSGGGEARAVIFVKTIPKPDKEFILKNLQFVFDSDELTPKSQRMLDRQVPTLKGLNVQSLIIVGHTDSLGNDDYNADLSQRRAAAIKRILGPALGLEESQITAIGKGESQPIATNKTEAGRQANRRVELKVYFKTK